MGLAFFFCPFVSSFLASVYRERQQENNSQIRYTWSPLVVFYIHSEIEQEAQIRRKKHLFIPVILKLLPSTGPPGFKRTGFHPGKPAGAIFTGLYLEMSDFSSNSNPPPELDRSSAGGSFSALVRLLRPRHWVKNLLLVAPLLLAHEFTDTSRLLPLLLGIISFSLVASLVYVVNDLVDIESDRQHPQKQFRPLAAGDLSRTSGVLLALVLAAGGIAAALAVSTNFLVITAVYLAATTLYSIWLKRVVIADVLMLASFYTLRILAGGIAASLEEPVSPWLLAFAMFLFTSLAFSKRHAELTRLASEQPESRDRPAAGRGYRVRDLGIIEVLGPTSGYLSVLVFTLYINREGIDQLYTYTWPLWTITLLLMYWISRLWLLARRGELKEDPVVFAVTDPVSLLVGLLVTGLAIVAAAPWVISG